MGMNATNETPATLIACTVCRHDVPQSEALSFEATDYVVHFCGLDCYRAWLTASRTPGDDTF
jgi:hypothetical protein